MAAGALAVVVHRIMESHLTIEAEVIDWYGGILMMNETQATRRSAAPLARVRAAGNSVVGFLRTMGSSLAYAREVERMTRLSDAELARRGLTRSQIADHVYRRYYGA